jgi:hypothetical protein
MAQRLRDLLQRIPEYVGPMMRTVQPVQGYYTGTTTPPPLPLMNPT